MLIGCFHDPKEPKASELDRDANEEDQVPSEPSPVASFVQKDGDNALLHLVAEFLACRGD